MTIINIIISIIFLYFTFKLAFKISKKYELNYSIIFFIISWHTFISIFYFFISFEKRSDALKYFKYTFLGQLGEYNQVKFFDFRVGTNAVYETIRFITSNFYLDYLNLFILFNSFGAIGLVLIYIKCLEVLKHTKLNYFLLFSIIFLPSMSFWSSAPGKDALSFLIVGLYLFSFNKKYYYIFIPLLSLLMFVVRPYIGVVFFISYFIVFIFKIKINYYYKFGFIFINIFIIYFSTDYVFSSLNFNNMFSLDSITEFIKNRQRASFIGNTKIDLFESNSLTIVYHYLFTPSLINYNGNSMLFLLMSLENTFLLMIILIMFSKIIINIINNNLNFKNIMDFENILILIISITLLIILSHATFNSGIANRQKYIFLPFLLYLLLKLSNINKNDNL